AVFKDRDGTSQDLYLFGLHAIDNDHAWAVGDRSILTSTNDGGKTWRARAVPMEVDLSGGQSLATADPIFYDGMFTALHQGGIVGEFGKIMHTTDGGETWREQEKSLMEGTSTIDVLDLPTLYGVHMMSPQHGSAAGLEGHIARTQDGQRWAFDKIDVEYPLVDPLFRVGDLPDDSGCGVGEGGRGVRRAPAAAGRQAAHPRPDAR